MPRTTNALPAGLVLLTAMAAGACSSGSDDPQGGGGNPPANNPPTASAGANQNVLENSLVTLDGSATDDAGALSYLWTQTAGTQVTLDNPTAAQASFTAPDVPATVSETLTFELTVTDAGSLSDSDVVDIVVSEAAATVTIAGQLNYEFPLPNTNCNGLNFNNLEIRPIRRATVQLLHATTGNVLATTISDDDGNYAFQADGDTSVFVRVRATIKRGASPSWDVEVRDNTSNTGAPLGQRPMYVLDGMASNPGGVDQTRNLLARTGWNGNGFSQPRAAAPFAVLDAIYSTMQVVLAVDPGVSFPPLDAFWSVNNTSAASGDVDIGELGSSFYSSGIDSLFLLGLEGDDIEEFDDHVIGHEWGHYFEDNFSRSDSIGGSHSLNDRLDARVAFGEGFATALSGMALGNLYCDTFWVGSNLRGFDIRLEDENTGSAAGWYNESSVMKILYDLYDNDIDGNDTASIGWQPMYDVFRNAQRTTDALTTVFSFIEAVKAASPANAPFIDTLVEDENIVGAGNDRWASAETNNAGVTGVLPVFTDITPNGNPVNICSSATFDDIGADSTGNKLGTHRYLRMDIPTSRRYTFDIRADAATLALLPPDDPGDARDQSDPDMLYFRNGVVQNRRVGGDDEGLSGAANVETFTSFNPIPAGRYVISLHDWRYEDPETSADYPTSTCFDVTVTPAT